MGEVSVQFISMNKSLLACQKDCQTVRTLQSDVVELRAACEANSNSIASAKTAPTYNEIVPVRESPPSRPENSELVAQLSDRIQRHAMSIEQLKAQMLVLQSHVDKTAVNAGFLALAIPECGHEEKRFIFDSLKTKEAEMLTREESSADRGAGVYAIADNCEFTVELDRRTSSPLGAEFVEVERGLLIKAIDDHGLIFLWNRTSLADAIHIGDTVVEANGVRGHSSTLVKECSKSELLRLVLSRNVSDPMTSQIKLAV